MYHRDRSDIRGVCVSQLDILSLLKKKKGGLFLLPRTVIEHSQKKKKKKRTVIELLKIWLVLQRRMRGGTND